MIRKTFEGKLMKRTMRKMRRLFIAAVIVLAGAAWADATSTSSAGVRTYTETTSIFVNREGSYSTDGSEKVSGCCDELEAASGQWYMSRSEAIAAAKRAGKKIFLLCGCDLCYDARTTKSSCEDPNVKPELTAKCVLWYSNHDTQENEHGKYLPCGDFAFPVVCVIDPYDPDTYIKRATGDDYRGALRGSDVLAFIADIPYPAVPVSSASDSSSKGLNPSNGGDAPQYQYADGKTLYGAVYNGDDVVGIVELKFGRANLGKNTGRVSGAVTLLDGKKCAIKSQQVAVDGTAPLSLEVKNVGELVVAVNDGQFSGTLGGWHVQTAKVGGDWKSSGVTVSVDVGDLSAIPGTVLDSLLPKDEKGTSSSSRWTFARAASVKWAKPRVGVRPVVMDATSGKGLIVDTSRDKTNLSGIKLTYTAKSGTFKGSFKVYALEGTGKSTKLKKYTVKVGGVVVDGVGYGSATCMRPEINWALTVR